MKKIYAMPTVIMVKIQSANLMEASRLLMGSTVNNVSGDSRRGNDSSWDDDEE